MIRLIVQIVAPQAKMLVTVELSFVHPQLVDNCAAFGLMVERMKPSVANHTEQTAISRQYTEGMLILEYE
jgi:hypothetical protein